MQMTMIEAINRRWRWNWNATSEVVLFGEDIGANGGVFRVTEHLQKQVRRGARLRYAPGRVWHHRQGGRHGGLRAAAHRRDSVCRFPLMYA